MRKFLLYSSALVAGGLLSGGAAEAACIQTPTCSSLGYTSTSSCTGGTKCPFGNAWNCTASEIKTELTNKITELEKIIEEIKQNSSSNSDILSNCHVGDILYSDKSCDPNVIATKKPIGVVFDIANKLAIGLEESNQYWSPEYFDVPGLSNITSSWAATADWQGKNNTRVVLEYCKANGKSCPAFEYVNSYKTEGTQAGDWYLPALGELNAIYGNKDVLNITLGKIGGTKLGADYWYWSSSEEFSNYAWRLFFNVGDVNYNSKYDNDSVRPVIDYGDWANSSAGDEEDSSQTCNVGDILYSDMTCNSNIVASKTPIGVVFDAENRKAIALESSPSIMEWSTGYIDIPGITNTYYNEAKQDFNGKANTAAIKAYDSSLLNYPAAKYVYEYKTTGTNAGDWYLPALGELNTIYSNKVYINNALSLVGKKDIPAGVHLSSSEYSWQEAWGLGFDNGYVSYSYKKNDGFVRPVLAF